MSFGVLAKAKIAKWVKRGLPQSGELCGKRRSPGENELWRTRQSENSEGGDDVLEAEMKDDFFWYLDGMYEKVRVIEEKVIGKSRADVVAVLPDKIIGFELKSDSDSYQRLITQVKDYDKYFDYNYLVVGKTHRKQAENHVPDHWGVICVSSSERGGTQVEVIKEAKPNPKLKMRWQLSLLWRSEMANIQRINGLYKYADKKKLHIIKYLIESVEPTLLKKQLCDELFERDYNM